MLFLRAMAVAASAFTRIPRIVSSLWLRDTARGDRVLPSFVSHSS